MYKVGKVHDLNWSPKFRRQNDLFGFTENDVSENNLVVRPLLGRVNAAPPPLPPSDDDSR